MSGHRTAEPKLTPRCERLAPTLPTLDRSLEDGTLELDAPIARYWPAFAGADGRKAGVTVRHALAHQAGLAAAMPDAPTIDALTCWANMTRFVAEAPPAHAPGAATAYHAMTFGWICGGLIEVGSRGFAPFHAAGRSTPIANP